jgi:ketosteroid isomerase-like protein
MKRFLMFLGLSAALGSAMATEQAPTGGRGGSVPTRNVAVFTKLENALIDAVQHHDTEALARIVSDDFELRSTPTPGVPTPRSEALQAWTQLPAQPSSIGQMAVHDYGDLMVVSFVWQLGETAGAGPSTKQSFFVVDTWKRAGADWKVAARYAAPIVDGAATVPGAVAASAQSLRKKI